MKAGCICSEKNILNYRVFFSSLWLNAKSRTFYANAPSFHIYFLLLGSLELKNSRYHSRLEFQLLEGSKSKLKPKLSWPKKDTYSKAPIIRTKHWAVLAVHSMYCQTGISTGTYNRNFRVFVYIWHLCELFNDFLKKT